MTKLKIFSVAALALLLASCGGNKKAMRSQEIPVTEQTREKRILYPSDFQGEVVDRAATIKDPRGARRLTFTEKESEHVRIPGINPLPASGVLELDLDRMADEFCYPYRGRFLSDYGMRGQSIHTGIDIKTIPNDTIRAAFPGVVRMSKNYSSYGNIVVIQHYYGFETVYSHCSKNLVKVNDIVNTGDPIGLGGRTGRATTEHLHFEVRAAGEHFDPKLLVDINTESLQKGRLTIRSQGNKIVAANTTSGRGTFSRTHLVTAAEPEDTRVPEMPEPVAEPRLPVRPGVTPSTAPTRYEPPVTNGSESSSPANTTTAVYHTVVKGDTLYAISRKYSTTVKKICDLNNIKENDILSLGQKLRVK